MHGPREILNELKWREGAPALAEAEVWYVHRGAPHDTRVVSGADVLDVGRSFLEVRAPEGVASIPMHRVYRIVASGRVVWERRH